MNQTAKNLRLVFAGTPDFSAQHLNYLIAEGFTIVGVYTQPDRPGKRGKQPIASPVKTVAALHGLPVYQPLNFKTAESIAELNELKADIMVVVAYGLLLPQSVLDAPKFGCINVHASLLPRWRGAAPIERAIAAGDTHTGITIMQMDAGLDTGDMLIKTECAITIEETGDSLRQKLLIQGNPALQQALEAIANGTLSPEQQDDSQSTYANKLSKQEAEINWQQSAEKIALTVRAFHSSNVAFTTLNNKNNDRAKIWQANASDATHSRTPGTIIKADKISIEVACSKGSLHITQLQLPGGKVLDCRAILNGRAAWFEPGTLLGAAN